MLDVAVTEAVSSLAGDRPRLQAAASPCMAIRVTGMFAPIHSAMRRVTALHKLFPAQPASSKSRSQWQACTRRALPVVNHRSDPPVWQPERIHDQRLRYSRSVCFQFAELCVARTRRLQAQTPAQPLGLHPGSLQARQQRFGPLAQSGTAPVSGEYLKSDASAHRRVTLEVRS